MTPSSMGVVEAFVPGEVLHAGGSFHMVLTINFLHQLHGSNAPASQELHGNSTILVNQNEGASRESFSKCISVTNPDAMKLALTQTSPVSQDAHPLLTYDDLAHRWQKSRMSLWRMRQAGHLPSCRIGRNVRFRLSDIVAYEQQSES